MTPAAAISLLAPDILVDGGPLTSQELDALVELKIRRGLRVPGRAVLTFADDGYALSSGETFRLGKQVRITLADGSELFSGEITGVDLSLDRGAPELSVITHDAAYRWARGNRARTFAAMTYKDVIETIAGESGVPVIIAGNSPLTARFDYLLQADTDIGFLSEIADRTGSDWYVQEGRLVVAAPGAGPNADANPRLRFGNELRAFSVRASGLHPATSVSRGWSPATKQAVSGSGTSASRTPTAALVQPHLSGSGLWGNAEVITARDNPLQDSEAVAIASERRSAWSAGAVTATGTCHVDAGLLPGGTVTVQDAGPASGEYQVTEVEHSYTSRGFDTRFTAGDRRSRSLVDTLAAGVPGSSFRHTGLMVGTVTSLRDPQRQPDCVKVKYPAVGDDMESNWARVASIGGGTKRGMTFLPEINDEVIVAFESGDPRRPVILGGMFNGKDLPEDYGADGRTITKRRITSRLGHYIEFGDGTAPGDQHVDVQLAGGRHQLRLGKDSLSATVPSGSPVTVAAGESKIAIDQAGAILLKGKSVTIDATTDVTINGVKITAAAKAALEMSATNAVLKTTANAEVSSGGPVSIRGAVVKVN